MLCQIRGVFGWVELNFCIYYCSYINDACQTGQGDNPDGVGLAIIFLKQSSVERVGFKKNSQPDPFYSHSDLSVGAGFFDNFQKEIRPGNFGR